MSLGLSSTSWRRRNVHCSVSDKMFWQLWRAVLRLRKSKFSRCKQSLVTNLKNSNCDKVQKLKLWHNSKTCIVTKLNSNLDKTQKVTTQKVKLWQIINSKVGYTERLWIFFSENRGTEENFKFFLPIFIILSDIEESIIRLSHFYLFRVQWRLNRFVYITTNHSCCPLNCSSM